MRIVLEPDYATEIRTTGWIHTTYNGITGWTLIAEDEEVLGKYLEENSNEQT